MKMLPQRSADHRRTLSHFAVREVVVSALQHVVHAVQRMRSEGVSETARVVLAIVEALLHA